MTLYTLYIYIYMCSFPLGVVIYLQLWIIIPWRKLDLHVFLDAPQGGTHGYE